MTDHDFEFNLKSDDIQSNIKYIEYVLNDFKNQFYNLLSED